MYLRMASFIPINSLMLKDLSTSTKSRMKPLKAFSSTINYKRRFTSLSVGSLNSDLISFRRGLFLVGLEKGLLLAVRVSGSKPKVRALGVISYS